MGYVVIGIDRVTGSALLLEEAILPTRQAAVDALRAVASSGQADLASYEVLIVDLDAATPVLVVEVPQPGFEAAEPPESVSASEVPLPAQMPGSEHVVAARLDEPEPVAADEAPVTLAPDAFAAAVEERPAIADAWMHEVHEPVSAPAPAVEEAPLAQPTEDTEEQALLDALRRAADSLVQQGIDLPEPIEIPEVPPASVEVVAASSESTEDFEQPVEAASEALVEAPVPSDTDIEVPAELPVVEPLGVAAAVEPASDAPPASTEGPEVAEPIRPLIMGEYPDEAAAATEPEPAVSEARPYEPSGDLEIAAYTCDDCVYSSTCPKAGESSPADCGTFQWRSF